jgi:hypothetical protein
MAQRRDDTDRAVPAHIEKAFIVEKQNRSFTIRFVWFTQQGSDHRFVAARLKDHRATKLVEFCFEDFKSFRKRTVSEIWPAFNDDPSRFASGVRINNAD